MEKSKAKIITGSIKPFIYQFGYAVIGLIIVVSVAAILKKSKVNNTIPTAGVFMIGYLTLAIALKKLPEIKTYWNIEKAYLLITGMVVGVAIQGIPFGLTYGSILSKSFIASVYLNFDFLSLGLTFLIVLWEELWFRNPILNTIENKQSQIILSIFTGLLFALLHILNPNINLWRDGPELFLAGTMLTLAYYSSRSFWLPLVYILAIIFAAV